MVIKLLFMVLWVNNMMFVFSVDLHNMCERNCQHCYMRRSNKDAKRFMCFPVFMINLGSYHRHMYMIIWNGYIIMELVQL